jgi:uncharacterized protein (DUF433 family)
MQEPWRKRITYRPDILAGKATIRGLRISVEQIVRALAKGLSREELLADYPDLEPEDLEACLLYAAELVAEEQVLSVSP